MMHAHSNRYLAHTALTVVLIHLFYYGNYGIQFDHSTLFHYWQHLDVDLLRNRLVESVIYMHSQPPLFNLFLGMGLKLFPQHYAVFFQVVYLLLGLGAAYTLFRLLLAVGISPRLSAGLTATFVFSPSFILYEHLLSYTFPVAALLMASALLLYLYLERGNARYLTGFLCVLFLLVATRSVFHLFYLLAGLLFLLATRWTDRRRIVLVGLLPILLVLGLYAKNLALFGVLGTSSWFGMGVWAATTRNIPLEERKQLVKAGKISNISLIKRFSAIDAYPEAFRSGETYDHLPALVQTEKSTGGVNYNYAAYIRISQQYFEDALYSLTSRPDAVLRGMGRSWFAYFKSTSDFRYFRGRTRAMGVDEVYDYLFYGKIPFPLNQIGGLPIYSEEELHFLYLFLMVGLPGLLYHGFRRVGKTLQKTPEEGHPLSPNQAWLVLYLCSNILYVTLVGNCFEVGENQRFRFTIDAFYLVLLALALQSRILPFLKLRLRHGR